MFEAERPGCRFSVQQRIGTYFYKVGYICDKGVIIDSFADLLLIIYIFCFQGVLYGSVGFACGIIGQGIANLIMTAKRYNYTLHCFL